jgi:hypothetical protein
VGVVEEAPTGRATSCSQQPCARKGGYTGLLGPKPPGTPPLFHSWDRGPLGLVEAPSNSWDNSPEIL